MPTPKTGHTASVINGKIYVIGGFFRGNGPFMYLSTVEIYDPETGPLDPRIRYVIWQMGT